MISGISLNQSVRIDVDLGKHKINRGRKSCVAVLMPILWLVYTTRLGDKGDGVRGKEMEGFVGTKYVTEADYLPASTEYTERDSFMSAEDRHSSLSRHSREY